MLISEVKCNRELLLIEFLWDVKVNVTGNSIT